LEHNCRQLNIIYVLPKDGVKKLNQDQGFELQDQGLGSQEQGETQDLTVGPQDQWLFELTDNCSKSLKMKEQ